MTGKEGSGVRPGLNLTAFLYAWYGAQLPPLTCVVCGAVSTPGEPGFVADHRIGFAGFIFAFHCVDCHPNAAKRKVATDFLQLLDEIEAGRKLDHQQMNPDYLFTQGKLP